LKCTNITTKTKVTKVRAEPKTINTADVSTSATLPWQCRWRDKLSVYLNHIICGGPVATTYCYHVLVTSCCIGLVLLFQTPWKLHTN